MPGPRFMLMLVAALASTLLAASVTTAASTASADSAAPIVQRGRVVKVVDGDTIDVRIDGGKERRVRLIGIDTPEVYGVVECGGPKASKSLKRMLPVGTRVRLVSDPTQDRKDFYGRILRYVTKIGTGQDVNRAQVWRGWARVYVFNHNPFKRVDSYRRAQRNANGHDRGIWGLC